MNKTLIIIVALLSGCSSTVIQYPSVCTNNEPNCKRNLNAQTLAIIGKEKAAIQLMCMDDSIADILGDECISQ